MSELRSIGRLASAAVAVLLFLGLLGAAAAAAAPRASSVHRVKAASTIPAADTIQIGPIQAADGFELYVTEDGCGSSAPYFQVAYLRGSSPDVLSHTYTGFAASCQIERTASDALLTAELAGLLDIHVQIGHAGAALRHPGLPVGCGAPYGPEIPARASGTIAVSIHPGTFGSIHANSASAQIFSGAPQRCPGVQSTSGRELTAAVDEFVIDGDAPAHGAASLAIFDLGDDEPAPGISGTLELEVGGRHGYAPAATGSATVGAGAPDTEGSLAFAALPACAGASAVNGTLTGTLTIEDPLLGPLAIAGADATSAYTGSGSAQPGTCNGPGSQPVEPEVQTTCVGAGSICSIAAGTNAVTFYDETDAGTEAITGEQINFGDGSAPVTIANYGTVEHTYTSTGSYTVTLTVTDATGATTTTTTSLAITS